MNIHFINVGQGNMVLIQIPEGKTILCDCNITQSNKDNVLRYIKKALGVSEADMLLNKYGKGSLIDIFINTHRDSDHMRGLKIINDEFGVKEIWDTGVPGTTTDSSEYREYMNLKRNKGSEKESRKYWDFGQCRLRIMNGKNNNFSDANEQSFVVKLEYKGKGIMLAGDTSYRSWKEFIEIHYTKDDLYSDILLTSHHGSISFFDDPSDSKNYYTSHISKINPAISIISVGDNDTHPDTNAVKLYETYSRGSKQGNKVFTTLEKGNMLLTIDESGGWSLKCNQ